MPAVGILLVLLALASSLSMAGGAVAGPFEDAQAAHGDQDAVSNRNRVARQMTPAQIAEAQTLAREWKPKPER